MSIPVTSSEQPADSSFKVCPHVLGKVHKTDSPVYSLDISIPGVWEESSGHPPQPTCLGTELLNQSLTFSRE
jgi:hypothetical protein